MNATTYRWASRAAATGARSLRPATRASVLQKIQARPFSGAQRLSQSVPHAAKIRPDDTVMYATFGAVGASVFFGMWYVVRIPSLHG